MSEFHRVVDVKTGKVSLELRVPPGSTGVLFKVQACADSHPAGLGFTVCLHEFDGGSRNPVWPCLSLASKEEALLWQKRVVAFAKTLPTQRCWTSYGLESAVEAWAIAQGFRACDKTGCLWTLQIKDDKEAWLEREAHEACATVFKLWPVTYGLDQRSVLLKRIGRFDKAEARRVLESVPTIAKLAAKDTLRVIENYAGPYAPPEEMACAPSQQES